MIVESTGVCPSELITKVVDCQRVFPDAHSTVIQKFLSGIVEVHILNFYVPILVDVTEPPVRSLTDFLDRIKGTVYYNSVSRSVPQVSGRCNICCNASCF